MNTWKESLSATIDRKRALIARQQESLEMAAQVLELLPEREKLESRLATAKEEQKTKISQHKALIKELKEKIVKIQNDPAVMKLETQLQEVKQGLL